MIFSIWKRAEAKATAHGLHMQSFPPQKWKGNCDSCWNFTKANIEDRCVNYIWEYPKNIVTNSFTPRDSKGHEKVSTSHLQVGELLLLMGDGLLHQDTLNALFHCILLCLRSKHNILIITHSRTTLDSRLFLPRADLPFAMLPAVLGWEAEGQAWSPCSVHSPSSELHLPEIQNKQFNSTVNLSQIDAAWSTQHLPESYAGPYLK